jgi:hypothetical protein
MRLHQQHPILRAAGAVRHVAVATTRVVCATLTFVSFLQPLAHGAASGSNGPNIALGKPVTAITNTVVGNVSYLTDGIDNTWYSYTSNAGGYHAMFTVDLGAAHSIGKINLQANQTSTFTIWSSTNGTDWTQRHSYNWTTATGLTVPAISTPVTIEPNGAYTARYFRYEGRSNWNQYVGLNEFEVYEWLGGGPTPPSLAGLANIALNKPVTNSYSSVAGREPSFTTDGNLNTFWQGNFASDNCASIYNGSLCPLNRWFNTSGYLTIDLGSSQAIQALRLNFPSGGVTGVQSLAVRLGDSADAANIKWFGTWGNPELIASNPPQTSSGQQVFSLSAPVSARYIFVWTVNWVAQSTTPVSLSEVEVFGTLPSAVTGPYHFVPIAPCRLVDTRNPAGTFGGPALSAVSTRAFPIPSAGCNIPSTARAYALNVTIVPKGPFGYLTIWPTGSPQPVVSTLNALDGRVKANAAIVPAGTGGSINVFVTEATELVLDINGYFVPPGEGTLQFYPVPPCRILDTRNPTGPLGGPSLVPLAARTIPVVNAGCGVSSRAKAYSLNATVIPKGPFGYLTLWPTGSPQPVVSTLNAVTGTVTANAALVQAGTSNEWTGPINVFGTENADLVLDINGYFALPGAEIGGMAFYTLDPCRISDTRVTPNGPFAGPSQTAVVEREYPLATSSCVGGPAAAYSLNATVVPSGAMGYLTLWPATQARPTVSTLNALDGQITSNAAIVVGGGSQMSILSFTTDTTHLLLDINGVFRPAN